MNGGLKGIREGRERKEWEEYHSHCSTVGKGHHGRGNSHRRMHLIGACLNFSEVQPIMVMVGIMEKDLMLESKLKVPHPDPPTGSR